MAEVISVVMTNVSILSCSFPAIQCGHSAGVLCNRAVSDEYIDMLLLCRHRSSHKDCRTGEASAIPRQREAVTSLEPCDILDLLFFSSSIRFSYSSNNHFRPKYFSYSHSHSHPHYTTITMATLHCTHLCNPPCAFASFQRHVTTELYASFSSVAMNSPAIIY